AAGLAGLRDRVRPGKTPKYGADLRLRVLHQLELPPPSGKVVQGLKSTYKRHGTVNLFAALEVATGLIRGKTTQTKKRVDFQAFMTELVAEHPPDREIHVILDNLSTHKKNDAWLAAHPNVSFNYTP